VERMCHHGPTIIRPAIMCIVPLFRTEPEHCC
jgi:hypothetical protein